MFMCVHVFVMYICSLYVHVFVVCTCLCIHVFVMCICLLYVHVFVVYMFVCTCVCYVYMFVVYTCLLYVHVFVVCAHVFAVSGLVEQSGCFGFGWTSCKNKFSFLQKANNKINMSASVIFGLIRLIILSYNRWKKHMKRCKIIGHPRIMLKLYHAYAFN